MLLFSDMPLLDEARPGVTSSSSMDIIPKSEAPPLDSRLDEAMGDIRAERLVEQVRVAPFLTLMESEGFGLGA